MYIPIKVNYAINRIHEKAFRSDLSTQIKNFHLTDYLLRIIFSCHLFVLSNFVRFFYDFCFFSGPWC